MTDQILTGAQSTSRAATRFRVLLDGTWYGVLLTYNGRLQWWSLDLEDAAGSPLVRGIRLAVGCSLLAPFGVEGLPPGQLFCLDSDGLDRDPDRHGLAKRVALIYRPAADVVAAAGTDSEVR